jgi:biotin carboxyl carrier protein
VKYVVTIEGESIEVEVDGDRLTIGGQSYHASLQQVPRSRVRHFLLDNRPTTLELERLSSGRWALTVEGERTEVEVLDERTRQIRTLTGTRQARHSTEVLRAPMPGMVVRVQARVGESVAAGAGLVVLEAMKMENELKAAADGKVKTVRVSPGEAVEKGQVLIEFEIDGGR